MMTGTGKQRIGHQYRSLIDRISDAIIVTSPDGTVRFVNPAAEALLGRPQEELLSRHVGLPLFNGDFAEVNIVRRDGNTTYAELRTVELEWDGEPACVLTLRDTTVRHEAMAERLRYEEELSRSEQVLRDQKKILQSILDSMAEGVVVCDATGKIVLCNPAAERLLGTVPADLSPECWAEQFGLYSADGVRRMEATPLSRAIAGEPSDEFEITIRNESNPEGRNIAETARPIVAADGTIRGAVAVLRDITERKKSQQALADKEEQLVQARKLQAIGQLAGGIAHDFNNLLNVISGHCELLLSELSLSDSIRSNVLNILNCASTAADLTKQLLAFSRRETGTSEVLDFNKIVGNFAQMLPRIIPENIRFEVRLSDQPITVRGSAGQIGQIVMNLVANARDAMLEGGELVVSTNTVSFDQASADEHGLPKPGKYACLSVTDNGIGMDSGTALRAFEPYFSTKPRGKGTGLGLAVVYGVVRNNGGHVRIASKPGAGTTVQVYWPQIESETIGNAPTTARTRTRGSETILLVEDFDRLREMTELFLKSEGYSVLSAANGAEALQVFRRHMQENGAVDLILTDVIMPGMSGPEVAKQLAAECSDVKVLYASGYTGDLLTSYGISEPNTALIEKPFSFDALAQKIRDVLQPDAAAPEHAPRSEEDESPT